MLHENEEVKHGGRRGATNLDLPEAGGGVTTI